MRKRAPALALAGLLALATAACGSGGDDSGAGAVSLRMTVWTANDAHLKLFNDIANAYKAAHPNVAAITFDPIPFDGYTTTLTTQIASGNGPDLAWILEGSAPDFVSSGALVDLSGKIEDTADLSPAATKLWTTDGKLYAYPFSTSPFGVFVNNDMFKAAGLATPAEMVKNGKWTWDDVVAAGAKINTVENKAGMVVRDFDYKSWDNLASVWSGWGAQAWSADGKTCGFNQQPMVDAMTFLHKAIFTDKAFPGPGVAADFFAGQSAMTITQISRASLLKDAKFGWDLVTLPTGPTGKYAVIGQAGLGALKKGKHADVAADFLAFFTNRQNSASLAAYFPPPRKSQLTAENLAKTNPLLKPEQLQSVVIDGIATGVVKPSHTGQAELVQAVRAALDPLWRPDADVKSVLDGVCTAINPLLSK